VTTPNDTPESPAPPAAAGWSQAMADAADLTRPSQAAVSRVAERLAVHTLPATDLLQELPAVPPGAAERVAARLAQRGPAAPWWQQRSVLAGAALLVASGLGSTAWWATRAAITVPPAVLHADGEVLTPSGEVASRVDGQGDFALVGSLLEVDWVVGELSLSAVPGLEVAVTTREATVHGAEPGMVVLRDALGTHVEVLDGEVLLRCEDAATGQRQALAAGEAATCLPTTATGLLGRARALGASGDTAAAVATADEALALTPEPAVAVELLHLQAVQLVASGDLPAAVAAAEEALALGVPSRSGELHRLAARGWLVAGDCERALPHLERLPVFTDDEADHHARCKATLEE